MQIFSHPSIFVERNEAQCEIFQFVPAEKINEWNIRANFDYARNNIPAFLFPLDKLDFTFEIALRIVFFSSKADVWRME